MKHESIEINSALLIILTLVVISIGGLVEIVPLFHIKGTVEEVEGVHPYTPLEQLGRDVYVREGCYLCHSQQIRPFRDEQLRYGHKRTGPDLARVGGKYSNEWMTQHLIHPQSLVPESIMPSYPWLMQPLKYQDIEARMKALRDVGVPYSLTKAEYEANVKKFGKDLADQFVIANGIKSVKAEAAAENWDGNPKEITEMDALVAYLQVLGTMVDFSKYNQGYFSTFR
ncbi:MAG: peptidase S41 [Halothiobacillus sp. 13-55-115]|nr:MAG: peptidase S41 [Halothiobacillus sp. 13-55-115]